jgi:gamma-glutamylcyclotransferase (GGCT)/AIG2-like uncharacterized protein YtfP
MANLFAYGTLMCEDIIRQVSGCCLSFTPGIVRGYCRRSVRGEVYPAIFSHEAGQVKGVVYRDLPDMTWRRLDLFEGNMYKREQVLVHIGEGKTSIAETYVVRSEFLSQLDATEWSFENFLNNGKKKFQKSYSGYGKL